MDEQGGSPAASGQQVTVSQTGTGLGSSMSYSGGSATVTTWTDPRSASSHVTGMQGVDPVPIHRPGINPGSSSVDARHAGQVSASGPVQHSAPGRSAPHANLTGYAPGEA